MKNQQIVTVLVLAIVAGAVGFFGGMQYQKSQTPVPVLNQFRRNGGGLGQNNTNNAVVRGEITAADDNSVTIKINDGSSKIVLLAPTTTITEATTAAKTELSTGKQVTIFGVTNTDGSVTAQNVQLGIFGRNPQPGQNQ
ncbi:hypothetical protein HY310_02190 [Candidatus Microgenomates bacterium]|nr:hypothetical protein [Candidatus Microgenomates bacterium]